MAAANGHVKVMELLKKRLPNDFEKMINLKNSFGNTPLHWAIMNYQKESASFLVINKADTGIKNSEGETALDIAIGQRNEDLVELIAKHTKIEEDEKKEMQKAERE